MRILLHSYHRRSKADFRATPLARCLAERGHNVTVMCIADHGRLGIRDHREDGVRFVEVPDLFTGKLRSSWDPWDALHRAVCLVRERFDVVHLFETRPAVIHPSQLNLWLSNAVLVTDWSDWWGRGGLIEHQRPAWYRKLFGGFETYYEERFRCGAQATTVISHALKHRAMGLGIPEETITWIPNGVSVQGVQVVPPQTHRARFGLPLDAFILCDSAHDVTMGIELTFRTVARLVAHRRRVLFMMTGRGQRDLEALAARHGVAAHFRHFGFVPQADLSELLSCADVYAIPYIDNLANRGRWPGRVGNYLPLGRPIVSNPVGEMTGLVRGHGVGVLVDETPQAMAEAIQRLMDDPAEAHTLGQRARRLAENELTWARMTDRLEHAYAGALARAPRPRSGSSCASVAAAAIKKAGHRDTLQSCK